MLFSTVAAEAAVDVPLTVLVIGNNIFATSLLHLPGSGSMLFLYSLYKELQPWTA